MSIVDSWIEEDYFTSLCIVMDNMDYPAEEIEGQAHRVLDTYTVDGVLDTDAVDCFIDYLVGVES